MAHLDHQEARRPGLLADQADDARKPILEHYSIALEAETGTGKIVTRDVKRAAILVQHYEVLTYRDQQTAADDELLNDAAAIYLGADNQGEFK